MAITFDPINKIIQLDRTTISERELWTAFVNWSVLSDNLKYGVGVTQLGGEAPVALYIYLELGWKIRPIEADAITTITGNLITRDGSSIITPTIGNWQSLVNIETPTQAVAIEVQTGGVQQSILDAIQIKIDELHRIQGLNADNPLVTTRDSMESGDVKIKITGNGETLSKFTRE
jgi:hypothetical protein